MSSLKASLDLNNKVILATGASGYLGSVFVEALSRAGASLALLDLNQEALDRQISALTREFPEQKFMGLSEVDLMSTESLDQALASIRAEMGKIDSAICAHYPRTGDWSLDFPEIPLSSWQKNIDLHLNGYTHFAQRVARIMVEQGHGHILFFGSIYGVVGPDFSVYDDVEGMTMPAAYAAIKGALANMTRYLACRLGPSGVRVNCLSPGGVFDNQHPSFVSRYESKVPLRRMATPEDVAGPLLFLCSDLASYVSGHNLLVDGGWTAL